MKKLLTVFLVIFAILLTGCYTESEEFKRIDPGELPRPRAGVDYTAMGYAKYETPVKITVAAVEFPLEPGVKDGTTPLNQSFNKIAKDVLNIELEYKVLGSPASFDTKLNLAIGAGEMPDMFFTSNSSLFANLMSTGSLADLSDVFYALNPELQNIYLNVMPELLPNCMENGKLYAFPMGGNKFEQAQRLYIRKDWLEKVNKQAPRTIQELIDVGQAFYDNAALLGLSQSTIIPLAFHKDITFGGTASAEGLFNCFGASPISYFDDGNGNLIAGATSQEMKNAITVMREMYSRKIIDPNFITKNTDKVLSDIKSGKVGMVFGEWFLPEMTLVTTVTNIPGADWVAVNLPLYGDITESAPVVRRVNINGYNVVSKNCKYPEAAAKLINLFYDLFYNDDVTEIYGEAIANLAKPENGFFHNYVPIKLWNSIASVEEHKRVKEVFEDAYEAGMRENWKVLTQQEYNALSEQEKSVYDEQLAIYNRLRKREKELHWQKGYGYYCQLRAGTPLEQMTVDQRAGWGIYHEMIDGNGGYAYVTELTEGKAAAKYNQFYGPPISTMVTYGDALNTEAAKVYTDIIRGEKPLSYWETFVSNYNKMGGDAILRQINNWYKVMKID